MTISVSDFSNWRQDPVTKAFFQACQERVEGAKEQLASSAGIDPQQDSFFRGFICAYREIPEFHIEDLEGQE